MSNTIRIISTSDVHGKVFPHSYGDGRTEEYGLLKLASLIEELRDENTVLIDNGDTLQGSALQFYHFAKGVQGSANHIPSPATKVMAAMKYDYINIGNHDFDYGLDALKTHIAKTAAKCINVNMGYTYDVFERCGKKIAIFGLLTSFTSKFQPEEKIRGAYFANDFEFARSIARAIKKEVNPHFIICCYHGGFEQNPEDGGNMPGAAGENLGLRMLEEIPEIDILIAGHQHTAGCGKYNGKAYTQPGADGRYLSVIEIDAWTKEITPKLLSLENQKPEPSKELAALVQGDEDACQRRLDEPIGQSNIDLSVSDEFKARLDKAQLVTFLNMVQMDRMGADISASSLFEGARGFGKSITTRDIVASYAYPNTLQLKKITGKVLREYLEKTLEYWTLEDGEVAVNPCFLRPVTMHYNYDMLDGVEYTADVSKPPEKRLTALTRDGKEIDDSDEFTIALNNYRAAGGGGYAMLAELPTLKTDLSDMVDVIAEYIMKRGTIDFEPAHNIKIVSGSETKERDNKMKDVFKTILLMAFPASGKSEVRNFLANIDPARLRDEFHIGENLQLDDFPYVHFMRLVDEELEKRGQSRLYYRSNEEPFFDDRDWGTLMLLLDEDYERLKNREVTNTESYAKALFERIDRASVGVGLGPKIANLGEEIIAQIAPALEEEAEEITKFVEDQYRDSYDGMTLVIECARGGPQGSEMPLTGGYGYQYSLPMLSENILGEAAILYIWVTPEESRRKNNERANPDDPGSNLFHGVPMAVMLGDYGCDDMEYLREHSEKPDTITVCKNGKTWHLPIGVFDNRVDKTSYLRADKSQWSESDIAEMTNAIKNATETMWKNYNKQ